MLKYAQANITPVSGASTFAASAMFVGKGDNSSKALAIWTEGTDSIVLEAYLDGHKIAAIDSHYFILANAMLEVDTPVPAGKEFKLALNSSSGTTIQKVMVKYEESE